MIEPVPGAPRPSELTMKRQRSAPGLDIWVGLWVETTNWLESRMSPGVLAETEGVLPPQLSR
jgi:hypothetical protein